MVGMASIPVFGGWGKNLLAGKGMNGFHELLGMLVNLEMG